VRSRRKNRSPHTESQEGGRGFNPLSLSEGKNIYDFAASISYPAVDSGGAGRKKRDGGGDRGEAAEESWSQTAIKRRGHKKHSEGRP